MKLWNDDEVKSLFNEVEYCKNNQQALRMAFVLHAKKFKRKPNSVRNYYYKEVDNLASNEQRCKRLGIALEKHQKTHFVAFDEKEEEKLLKDVSEMVASGKSVRAACQILSGGNLSLMTRLQNKYQNSKKKESNVIPFRQKQKLLTENDINSLFMGLVKLIKKTAIEDFMEKTKLEKQSSSFLLKKAFLDLNKKDKQIADLRADFEKLKEENKTLLTQLEKSASKNDALKRHLLKNKGENFLENKKV